MLLNDTLPIDTASVIANLNSRAFDDMTQSAALALAVLHAHQFSDYLPNPDLSHLKSTGNAQQEGNFRESIEPLITAYPNPAIDRVMITYSSGTEQYAVLRLFNASSKLIQEETLNGNGLIELDLRNLSDGLYLVQIMNQNQVFGAAKLTIKK
jgi:hypothetical protein